MSAVMSGTYTGDVVGSTKIEQTKSKSGLNVLRFGSPQSQLFSNAWKSSGILYFSMSRFTSSLLYDVREQDRMS